MIRCQQLVGDREVDLSDARVAQALPSNVQSMMRSIGWAHRMQRLRRARE